LGEIGQCGLDLEPAILLQGSRYEGAFALLRFDDAVPRQQLDRLPDRDARHAELLRQLLVGRQPEAFGPYAACDPLPEDVGDLRVFRNVAVVDQVHLKLSRLDITTSQERRSAPRSSGWSHWCWPK